MAPERPPPTDIEKPSTPKPPGFRASITNPATTIIQPIPERANRVNGPVRRAAAGRRFTMRTSR